MAKRGKSEGTLRELEKCPTGIRGLDEITNGGLPRGRPTLVCGGAGSGKTLLAMEFIVRGARDFGEPGVFMSFEEGLNDLAKNVASLGFDLPALVRRKKLAMDYVHIERSEIEETGEYDLDGLFVRLASMVEEVGAKRVVLDTVEALFAGLPNEGILRAELRRLFRWLRERNLTALITGEQGERTLTRHGLEEYVSDCVIVLDHRVHDQVATRRLRVVKYRGSQHGTNEYPTMIDEKGLSVLPISSLGLNYAVSAERVPSGISRLDTMLDGKGYYRGSTVLVSGAPGTGKTSIAAAYVDAACRRGERCLYCSFEESPSQMVRNMRSIGYDLGRWQKAGLLQFHTVRPTMYGLESHLVTLHKLVEAFRPAGVVLDPVTSLMHIGEPLEVQAMLTRVIDYLKGKGVTAILTSLTEETAQEASGVEISSLIDTWLLLRNMEMDGERNRLLYVLKSRGMAHSNQVREFNLSSKGIDLLDVYVGPGEVLAGSARLAQEARGAAEAKRQKHASRQRQLDLKREELAVQGQLEAMNVKLEQLRQERQAAAEREEESRGVERQDAQRLAAARKAD